VGYSLLQIGVLAVPILQLATKKKKREESKLTMWYEYSKSFVSNKSDPSRRPKNKFRKFSSTWNFGFKLFSARVMTFSDQ
jgi:hypothetical protein